MPGMDGINAVFMCLFLQLLYQSFGNAVDATYGRHNPNLITYTYIAILSYIALKGAVFFFYVKFLVYRLIRVFKCAREVGLQIVLIHPVASLQVFLCMTNRIAVFYDICTLRGIFYKYLVPSGRVLVQDNLTAIHLNDGSFLLGLQTYNNAVGRINFQVSCLFHCFIIYNSNYIAFLR